MNGTKPQVYFFLALLVGALVLSFFVFQPFLYALILAVVFAIVFQPLYRRIATFFGGRRGVAAFLTIVVVLVFVLTPLSFIGKQVFEEAYGLYQWVVSEDGATSISGALASFPFLKNIIPADFLIFEGGKYFEGGLNWFIRHFGTVFSNIASTALNTFIFLIALYYFLKDGVALKRQAIELSPLADTNDEVIFEKLRRAVGSVVTGKLIIALIQGALIATGFAIFGVPNAVLWGTVGALAALVPSIGTAIVLVPGIIFLFVAEKTGAGVGLLIWGAVAVGLVDNLLAPVLVGKGAGLHPLVVLLSALGGIALFGPVGFILGPLVISFFIALLDIYSSMIKRGNGTEASV